MYSCLTIELFHPHHTAKFNVCCLALAGCLCDVTPDFCDIGCCCDVMDCGLLNLSSVFNNCGQDAG